MVWTPRSEKVITEVAEEYGVSAEDIRGRRRDPLTVDARDKAMYRLSADMGLGITRVARMFERNATCVGRSIRRHMRKEEIQC